MKSKDLRLRYSDNQKVEDKLEEIRRQFRVDLEDGEFEDFSKEKVRRDVIAGSGVG